MYGLAIPVYHLPITVYTVYHIPVYHIPLYHLPVEAVLQVCFPPRPNTDPPPVT
ncbi:hypothetical protein B484DRAFT_459903, partial [Ochromonadaceae sp. CCMP2298]